MSRYSSRYAPIQDAEILVNSLHGARLFQKSCQHSHRYVVKRFPLSEKEGKVPACFYQAWAERTVGEWFRFLMGPKQPKTRMLCDSGVLRIASKYVSSTKQLNQLPDKLSYLKHYAEGLVYALGVRDLDRHGGQILVTKKNEAIFIDFDRVLQNKKWVEKRGLNSTFNSADIRFQPFVGEFGNMGGVFQPLNWLHTACNRKEKGERAYASELERYDHDVNTYRDPRFQHDMHRALLKLLMLPKKVYYILSSPRPDERVGDFEPWLSVLEHVSQKVRAQLLDGMRDLVQEASKIPEFIDYLKKLSLWDVAEIATEFKEFMRANPKYQGLNVVLGSSDNWSAIFTQCIETLRLNLSKDPFSFSEENMPSALSFGLGLSEAERKVLQNSESLDALDPEFRLFYLEHQLRIGRLHPGLKSEIPEGKKAALIRRVIEGQELLSRVLEHFDLKLFLDALCFISNPEGSVSPPIEARNNSLAFLSLDAMTLQRILNYYFPHQRDYEIQCLALNLTIFLDEWRAQKIKTLEPADYSYLLSYLTERASAQLAQDLHRQLPFLADESLVQTGIILGARKHVRDNPNAADRVKQSLLGLEGEDASEKYPFSLKFLSSFKDSSEPLKALFIISANIHFLVSKEDKLELVSRFKYKLNRGEPAQCFSEASEDLKKDVLSRIHLDLNFSLGNYKSLIKDVLISHPFFTLIGCDAKLFSAELIAHMPCSDLEREQLSIIHHVIYNAGFSDDFPFDLLCKIQAIPLAKTSAEFIFRVMEEIDAFLHDEPDPETQAKLVGLMGVLLYALPYDSKKVSQHTAEAEVRASEAYELDRARKQAQLMRVAEQLQKSGGKAVNIGAQNTRVSDVEKIRLLEYLEREINRQVLIKENTPEEGKPKIQKRMDALKNTRDSLKDEPHLSWLFVDIKLRELSRCKSVNRHRSLFMNHFPLFKSLFKTDTRKAIDAISRETVEAHRQVLLRS